MSCCVKNDNKICTKKQAQKTHKYDICVPFFMKLLDEYLGQAYVKTYGYLSLSFSFVHTEFESMLMFLKFIAIHNRENVLQIADWFEIEHFCTILSLEMG